MAAPGRCGACGAPGRFLCGACGAGRACGVACAGAHACGGDERGRGGGGSGGVAAAGRQEDELLAALPATAMLALGRGAGAPARAALPWDLLAEHVGRRVHADAAAAPPAWLPVYDAYEDLGAMEVNLRCSRAPEPDYWRRHTDVLAVAASPVPEDGTLYVLVRRYSNLSGWWKLPLSEMRVSSALHVVRVNVGEALRLPQVLHGTPVLSAMDFAEEPHADYVPSTLRVSSRGDFFIIYATVRGPERGGRNFTHHVLVASGGAPYYVHSLAEGQEVVSSAYDPAESRILLVVSGAPADPPSHAPTSWDLRVVTIDASSGTVLGEAALAVAVREGSPFVHLVVVPQRALRVAPPQPPVHLFVWLDSGGVAHTRFPADADSNILWGSPIAREDGQPIWLEPSRAHSVGQYPSGRRVALHVSLRDEIFVSTSLIVHAVALSSLNDGSIWPETERTGRARPTHDLRAPYLVQPVAHHDFAVVAGKHGVERYLVLLRTSQPARTAGGPCLVSLHVYRGIPTTARR